MKQNILEQTIDVLALFNDAIAKSNTLEDALKYIVLLTCEIMDSTQGVFLLADAERQIFTIRAMTGIDIPGMKEGGTLMVPRRLHNILWKMRYIHQVNWIDSGMKGVEFPIISMPIYYRGTRIGLLLTGGFRDLSNAKDPLRRKLFSLLAPFASLLIENAKAMDLVQQRFLMPTAGDNNGTAAKNAEQLLVASVQNPLKVVRMFADSFYTSLVKAGFDSNQMAHAAARVVRRIAGDDSNPPEK